MTGEIMPAALVDTTTIKAIYIHRQLITQHLTVSTLMIQTERTRPAHSAR
jgi:hypothetical protein